MINIHINIKINNKLPTKNSQTTSMDLILYAIRENLHKEVHFVS